jgi:hypothetical protein
LYDDADPRARAAELADVVAALPALASFTRPASGATG